MTIVFKHELDVRLISLQAHPVHLSVACYRLLISEISSSSSSPDSTAFFQVSSLKPTACKAMRLDLKNRTMNYENRNICIMVLER